jgi:hypothetical protein
MTSTRLWDRAAALPVPVDGRRVPEVAALPAGLPTVADLFDFMRDAETRFATLRMRIVDRTWTARGEEATTVEVMLRHPGAAKVVTSLPGPASGGRSVGGPYEIWITDGDLVRTYASAHTLGTQRPIRNRPRGLGDPDFPGTSMVYEPVTPLPAETLPETFIHPAGFCQNVLATGPCTVTGTDLIGGREAILLRCEHPRTMELAGDRPDFRLEIGVDRETGVIVRLIETIGGVVARHAEVTDLAPDAPLPPAAFDFVFPSGTTMLY